VWKRGYPAIAETEEGSNPFSVFDEIAPALAFCHMKYGAEGLHQMLQWMVDPSSAPAEIKREHGDDWPNRCHTSRENFERYAEELEAVGLPEVAAIVVEYAATVPPPSNPFDEMTDCANWRDWNRRNRRDFTDYLYDDIDRACVVANRLNK
jgi:hypothetical protein